MPDPELPARIRERAQKAQRGGKAGDALKLHILANEVKTVKVRQ